MQVLTAPSFRGIAALQGREPERVEVGVLSRRSMSIAGEDAAAC